MSYHGMASENRYIRYAVRTWLAADVYHYFPDRWQSGSGADSNIVRDQQMLAINSPQLRVCVQQLLLQE